MSCWAEGVTGVYLSATTLLSASPCPRGRGELCPGSPGVCPQVTMTAGLCSAAERGGQPWPNVPSHTAHGKPLLLRSELVWTREGKPFLSQNSPQVDGTERFLARSPPLCPGCAGRVVTARGLLGLTTDGTTRLSPPRPLAGSESLWNLCVRSANTSFGRITPQGGGKKFCAVSRWFFLAEGSLGKDRETMGD